MLNIIVRQIKPDNKGNTRYNVAIFDVRIGHTSNITHNYFKRVTKDNTANLTIQSAQACKHYIIEQIPACERVDITWHFINN